MDYSYIFGILPSLDLTGWHYVYLTLFLLAGAVAVSVKIASSKKSKQTKFYYFLSFGLGSLLLFGLVGVSVLLVIAIVAYALFSEFRNDY